MKAIINADDLSAWLDTISALVEECVLHCETSGIRTAAVDPANVGMIKTMLGAGAFESYEADGEAIGINLSRLSETLALAESDDLVELETELETGTLTARLGGLTRTVALIDPDAIRQEPDIPSLDFPADIRIPADGLSTGVTMADLVSDHVGFEADAGGEFRIVAEGDVDDAQLAFAADEMLDGSEIGEHCESLFSLDYLKDMDKGIADEEVRIQCGTEIPTKLKFEPAENASATYLLAPRIQSD